MNVSIPLVDLLRDQVLPAIESEQEARMGHKMNPEKVDVTEALLKGSIVSWTVGSLSNYINRLIRREQTTPSVVFDKLYAIYRDSKTLSAEDKKTLSLAIRHMLCNYLVYQAFERQKENDQKGKTKEEKNVLSNKLVELERNVPQYHDFLPQSARIGSIYTVLNAEDPDRSYHQLMFFDPDGTRQHSLGKTSKIRGTSSSHLSETLSREGSCGLSEHVSSHSGGLSSSDMLSRMGSGFDDEKEQRTPTKTECKPGSLR